VAIVSDQKDGAGKYLLVDARPVFGSGGLRGTKTSGDYDSLLL
jgi:hypothetical protein